MLMRKISHKLLLEAVCKVTWIVLSFRRNYSLRLMKWWFISFLGLLWKQFGREQYPRPSSGIRWIIKNLFSRIFQLLSKTVCIVFICSLKVRVLFVYRWSVLKSCLRLIRRWRAALLVTSADFPLGIFVLVLSLGLRGVGEGVPYLLSMALIIALGLFHWKKF